MIVGKGEEVVLQLAMEESLASTQLLTLPPGIYVFSVQAGAPIAHYGPEIAMPSLGIGLAPVRTNARVDFFAGPGTLDRWLSLASDRVVARISNDSAGLLLTSLRRPGDKTLSIGVRRIDAPSNLDSDGRPAPLIMAHVRQLGDLFFPPDDAGVLGSELWIEAFLVSAKDPTGGEIFEYRGVTADGFDTPWLSDSVLCGSRGRGTPLLGFAVRPRIALAERCTCSYIGHFGSGYRVGPIRDGSLCRSEVPDDPLIGIQLRIIAGE